MTLGNDRAVKTGQWYANEILMGVDINFIGQSTYENLVDQLSVQHVTALESGRNLVLGGLNLEHDNLLTVDLKTGLAISPKGTYFDGDAWGFVASPGLCFLAMVPKDQSVAFESGGVNDRIDTVEIHPIEILYNSVSRDFKDPLTQQVTGSLTNTRKEYGYEFAVRKGDDSSALAIEQSDFTFLDSYAAFAGKYCLFSTAFGDYYIWWDVDDGNADPAISGRTGIEIDLASATHTTATLVATKTETDLIAANIQGISVSRTTVVLSIDTTTYGDYADATIGDVLGSDLSLVVTDGNGPAEETAGWIKIAEVAVGNGASAITQSDIVGYDESYDWNTSAETTVVPISELMRNVLNDETAADVFTTLGITAYIQTLLDDTDASAARTTLEIKPQWTSAELLGSGLSIPGLASPALATLNDSDVAIVDAGFNELRTYRFDGSTWAIVGSGLSIPGINFSALAALNGTDVAFIEDGLKELRMYRFNGSTWSLIGSGLLISGISIPSLTALSETDVAYFDSTLDELRTYHFNGSTWAIVGSGLSIPSVVGISALAALNGTDVAFIDQGIEELRMYRFNGSTWSLIGSGLSITGLDGPSLTALNDTDVAFIDATLKELRMYRFNGSTWSLIGSGLLISGISRPALAAIKGTDVAFVDATIDELRTYRFGFSMPEMVPYHP